MLACTVNERNKTGMRLNLCQTVQVKSSLWINFAILETTQGPTIKP
jgi:hypothetical protein